MNEKRYKRLCDSLEDEQCKLDMFEKMIDHELLLTDGKTSVQLACSEAEHILYHLFDVKTKKIDFIKKQLEMEETE